MEKNKNSKTIIFFAVFITFILITLITYNFINRDNGLNSYKIDKHKAIVYDVYSKKETHVPEINLKSDNVSIINNQIIERANSFLVQNDKNTITYDFDISGEILSLAIVYTNYKDVYPTYDCDVYNINIYSSKVYTKDEILNLYELKEEEISPMVESKFREFYDKLLGKYFDEECNYDCFLYMRGIKNNNYMENTYYYLKDKNLYVVKPFNIYSSFSEENFFTLKDFLIQITQ